MSNTLIRTDGDLVKLARRMEVLNRELNALIALLDTAEHPNADKFRQDLRDNDFDNTASPATIVLGSLLKPEAWEMAYGTEGLRHKKGKANA